MTQNGDHLQNPTPVPAAPATPARTRAKQEGLGDASLSQIIDTIEAIIIALIVALTFRAFIVEAFVIPTGSMAPTLLGAHYKVICPECGCPFDLEADLSFQVQFDGTRRVVPVNPERRPELRSNSGVPLDENRMVPIYCPNCRYAITPKELPQYLVWESDNTVAQRDNHKVPMAWANNGDRILVLKYLYSIVEPTRWDVIVFKEPQSTRDNYIKRLIGLPGDSLEIINGDVYIAREGDPKDRTNYQIARKPDMLQNSLWQLVYNNDYYPIDAGKPRVQGSNPNRPAQAAFNSPWEGDANWTHGPVMSYAGAGPSNLTFNLTPAQAAESPYTLNTLGFNNDLYPARDGRIDGPRWYVGDLRLEALWQPANASSLMVDLTLGRPANCYRVNWSAAGAKLLRFNTGTKTFEPIPGATAAITPEAGKSYQLALNNVDRAVQFTIDGKEVISYQQPWNAQQAHDEEMQSPSLFENNLGMNSGTPDAMIRIDVGGPCSLAHLKLFRDLFYTQVYGIGAGNPPTGTEGHAITLGPDEFFAMGDNSRRSSDSRYWSFTYDAAGDLGLRNGIVPRRYLLGKAFFVYWPAGYRASDSIPVVKEWPLVPNIGDMRIIR